MLSNIYSYKIGLIRVITCYQPEKLYSHEKILKRFFPQFEVSTKCIPDQYEGIHDEETLKIAEPKIIELAKKWEKEVDGIIISCAADPSVVELRKILSIPVVGAGSSSALLSLNYGEKVGIIGIEEQPSKSYLKILGDKIIGYRQPKGVKTTNDLQSAEAKNAIISSALELKNYGADVIAFACTGLSTINATHLLKDIGIPVVDAVFAEGLMMLGMCINKKLYLRK